MSQVSGISVIFECLLDEEEKALKENPINSLKWAEVVIDVNNIIKVRNATFLLPSSFSTVIITSRPYTMTSIQL